jgi:hypothetical protein
MDVFEFVVILVIITTLGKVAMAVGAPLVDKIGDLVKELAASRRGEGQDAARLDPVVMEDLENRLARIEDRLDFLEELRAPDRRRAIGRGGLDRGAGQGAGGGT